MCRRDTNDVLIRRFLDRYQVNLLSMPGRRVQCGSVYIKEGGRLAAPGSLNDIVEPKITLEKPFVEDQLPDLSGTWSDAVSVNVGLGLMENFLTAIGAVGVIDELRASVRRSNTRNIAFRFEHVSRESLSATGLGAALAGRRLSRSNPWIREGNQYYAVAAVLRSRSLSIQGRDEQDSAVDLGAGLATVVDTEVGVEVQRKSESELVFSGRDALAIGVELYELRWHEDEQELAFHTVKGTLPLRGIEEREPPDPVFIGDEENVLIAPEELAPGE